MSQRWLVFFLDGLFFSTIYCFLHIPIFLNFVWRAMWGAIYWFRLLWWEGERVYLWRAVGSVWPISEWPRCFWFLFRRWLLQPFWTLLQLWGWSGCGWCFLLLQVKLSWQEVHLKSGWSCWRRGLFLARGRTSVVLECTRITQNVICRWSCQWDCRIRQFCQARFIWTRRGSLQEGSLWWADCFWRARYQESDSGSISVFLKLKDLWTNPGI